MENLPIYIAVSFILITFLSIFLFYRATKQSKMSLALIIGWLIFQGSLSLLGFYKNTTSMPPRLVFALGPVLILNISLFATQKGSAFIDSLDIKTLTLLHVVRIPVELVLYGLFVYKAIPEIMTFEGRNWDILSGITAPIMYYFAFAKKQLPKTILLIWNFICLGLLVNIVSIAILSAPTPFQQLALYQPNVAILHFPFVWLPAVVVPLVLFAHLVSIRKLLKKADTNDL
jgi:hypothetical protein